jgi:hypothetical protein
MPKFGSFLFGLAGLGAALLGAAPANAAAMAPNGSFTFPVPAAADTGDITSATTSLIVGRPTPSIGGFTDPFLGSPDNFCGAAGGGCNGSHPPGFLFADRQHTTSSPAGMLQLAFLGTFAGDTNSVYTTG